MDLFRAQSQSRRGKRDGSARVRHMFSPRLPGNLCSTSGLQLHMSRFLNAVDVSERRCKEITTTDRVQSARDFQRVLRAWCKAWPSVHPLRRPPRRRPRRSRFPARDRSWQSARGAFRAMHRSSRFNERLLPSNMWPVKRFGSPCSPTLLRFGDQGKNEFLEFVFQAVVGDAARRRSGNAPQRRREGR